MQVIIGASHARKFVDAGARVSDYFVWSPMHLGRRSGRNRSKLLLCDLGSIIGFNYWSQGSQFNVSSVQVFRSVFSAVLNCTNTDNVKMFYANG